MKKLLFLLAFCGTAQAATQGLTINGTVSSVCAFASVQNGTFGFDVTSPNVLDTNATGGTNASVVINYNGTPTVSIDQITSFASVPSGFTDTVNFLNVFTSSNNGAISYSSGTASFTQSGGINDNLTLRLQATDANGSFPTGNYSASTTITCQ